MASINQVIPNNSCTGSNLTSGRRNELAHASLKILKNPFVLMLQGLKPVADDGAYYHDRELWNTLSALKQEEKQILKKFLKSHLQNYHKIELKENEDIEIDVGRKCFYLKHYLELLSKITGYTVENLLDIATIFQTEEEKMGLIHIMFGNMDIVDQDYAKNDTTNNKIKDWYQQYKKQVLTENPTIRIYNTTTNAYQPEIKTV